MKIKLNKQRGFDILQLALVLVIVAILGSFGYKKFNETRADAVIDEERSEVSAYLSKAAAKFDNDPDYSQATLQVLIDGGVFTARNVSGGVVKNRFGGTVSMATNTIVHDNDSLKFSSTRYTKNGCNDIAEKLAPGVLAIIVNGTTVKEPNGSIKKAELGNSCTADSTVAYIIGK